MANGGEGLQIAVGANIKELERQMRTAAKLSGQAADDIEAKFRKLNPTINTSGLANAAKGFAAAFTFDKIIRGLAEANSELVRMGETAKRVGLDVERFQQLQFAGRTNGLTNKEFGTGIEGLAEKLNESRQQENALSKLFDENNVKLKDRKGAVIDINTALGEVANLTKNAATEFDKIAIAEAAGLTRDWVPLLEQGAAAISRQAEEARKTGNIIDSDIIAKAKVFEQDWSSAVERWANLIKANAGGIIALIDTIVGKAAGLLGGLDNYSKRLQAVADIEAHGLQGASRETLAYTKKTFGADADPIVNQRLDAFAESDRESVRGKSLGKVVPKQEFDAALRAAAARSTTNTSSLFDKGKKGGGGSDEDRVTSVERYVDALTKAQAVAQAELATVGLSVVERAKAVALANGQAAAQRDVTAGLRETAVLTQAEKDKILGIASATAEWKEQTRQVKEALDFAKDLTSDVAKGFVDDLMAGKSAADALNGALKRIASTLANKALDGLVNGLFGSGGFNIFSAFGGGSGGGLSAAAVKFADGGPVGSINSDSMEVRA